LKQPEQLRKRKKKPKQTKYTVLELAAVSGSLAIRFPETAVPKQLDALQNTFF
jgi:hypothetical protein